MPNSQSTIIINTDHTSPNYSLRGENKINYLILHYTADASYKDTLATFGSKESQVSAHYVVPKNKVGGKLTVFQLLDPATYIAWHAGKSRWRQDTSLNKNSIGIENVNLGYKDEEGKRIWFNYTEEQIQMLIELCKRVINEFHIPALNVLGHSDIATPPGRKVDPGPRFPWKRLYEEGIGTWYDQVDSVTMTLKQFQSFLKQWGFSELEPTGTLDDSTREVTKLFQMHYRPDNCSGDPDDETVGILHNLVHKYYPQCGLENLTRLSNEVDELE